MTSRASWHQYFLGIAQAVASRSTCPRKSVGAVLVRDRVIVSTGYNGSACGDEHCIERGCDLAKIDGRDSCQRVVHAEANAVAQAAQIGSSIKGAAAYVTCSPCWPCFKLLVNAGITQVFFGEQFYRDGDRIAATAEKLGIWLVKIDE